MRKLEILIIVFILLALAALVGCKDKAEAVEEGTFDITLYSEPEFEDANYIDVTFCYDHNGVTEELTLNVVNGEIVCSRSPKKAIEIIFKTMYYNWGERNKGDVYDLPVRFPEPNEPECKGHGVTAIYCPECHDIFDEPNESSIDSLIGPTDNINLEVYEGQIFYDKREGIEPEKRMWIFDGNKFLQIDEVNESECTHKEVPLIEFLLYECSCGKIFNTWEILMRNIPTWPDYIELDKTLIIREPANIREIVGFEHDFSVRIELKKGTKIYFKD